MCYNVLVEDTPLRNLITTIKEKLASRPDVLSAVQKIGLSIEKTGMSVEDSALIARMTAQELSVLSAEFPEIPLYFRLKRAQFKEKLLEVLHTHATVNKDVKIAQYLLETNFSAEYSPAGKKEAAKANRSDGSDLEKLMQRVRTLAPNSPVIESNTITPEETKAVSDYEDITKLVHG